MSPKNPKKELADTQKLVKDAAAALRKAADRAAKVAKSTGSDIARAKEMKEARRKARGAFKAIAAAARVASDAVAKGVDKLGDSKEVKKAAGTTKKAASSAVKAARAATGAAASKAKSTARGAKKKARSTAKKVKK